MGTWEELQAVKGHTQICTLTSLVAACGVEYGLEWEIYYKNKRDIRSLFTHPLNQTFIKYLLHARHSDNFENANNLSKSALSLKLGCGDRNLLYLYHPIW